MSAIKFLNRGTRGEIWLYGPVGDAWGDGMTAKQFAAELGKLGQVNSIDLHINSEGGSVFDGLAIYNQLERHPARIEVNVDGLAASIASVIAMAGDSIAMSGAGMLMIHDPWTMAFGDAGELRKTADLLDSIKGQIVNVYAKRTGLPAEEVAALMADETWMEAGTAQQRGFIDSVTEALPIAASADLSRFRRAPQRLLDSRSASTGHAMTVARAAAIEQRMRVWRAAAA